MVEPPGTATSVPQWRQEPRQERRSPILKENVPDAKISSKSSNLEKWRQTGLRLARARGLPTSMAGERRPLSTLQPFLFHPFFGGVGSSCLATLPRSGFSWPPSLGEQWWPTGIGHRLPIYRLPGRNTNNQYTNPDAGTHRKTISKLSATNSVPEEDSSKSIGHKIQSFHKSQQLSIAAQYRTPISERFGRRNGAQGHLGDGQSYCDSYEANDSY